MYGLKTIKRINEQAAAEAAPQRRNKPWPVTKGPPRPLTPYRAAAKFWPGVPEQIEIVTETEGFEPVESIEVDRFTYDTGRAKIAELRQWIREAPLKTSAPYIGITDEGEEWVKVTLFKKV